MYFRIFFFHFYENDIGILIGVALNLYLVLGSVEMSTVVSPVYEYGMAFQIFLPCLILSTTVCSFKCTSHLLPKGILSLLSLGFSESVVGRMGS